MLAMIGSARFLGVSAEHSLPGPGRSHTACGLAWRQVPASGAATGRIPADGGGPAAGGGGPTSVRLAGVTTTTGAPAEPVTAAATALAVQQRRVASLLARVTGDPALPARARRRLVRLGHFPAYTGELDWTAWEVAGHLRDSARVFTDRIERIGSGTRPALPDFVPDEPTRVGGYRATPPAVLAAELAVAQAGLLAAVRAVRPDRLGAVGVHEVDGPVTLAEVLAFLPAHQRDHAEQLAALVDG
jgi:hypothetical protein